MVAEAIIGGVQAATGIYQIIKGQANAKKYGKMAKAFQTPEEVYKAFMATESMQGGDTATRDFEVGQVDRAFSQSLGVAQRLGADPNFLSEMFGEKVNNIIKVGQQFHLSNLEGFSKLMAAYGGISEGKAAEWASRDAILKNKLQQAAGDQTSGMANLGSAANAFLSMSSAKKQMELFKLKNGITDPAEINQNGITVDDIMAARGYRAGLSK